VRVFLIIRFDIWTPHRSSDIVYYWENLTEDGNDASLDRTIRIRPHSFGLAFCHFEKRVYFRFAATTLELILVAVKISYRTGD
jgi:hypothetical protein